MLSNNDNYIYLVSSSVYELAWVSKLPFEALAALKILNRQEALIFSSTTEEVSFSEEGACDFNHTRCIRSYASSQTSLRLLLDNLLRVQHRDGSWGSKAYSPSDRLVNTLSAVCALAYNRKRWEQPLGFSGLVCGAVEAGDNPGRFPHCYQRSLQAGLKWLGEYFEQGRATEEDLADLAGLELLVPGLLAELSTYGIYLPNSAAQNPDTPRVTGAAMLEKARFKLGLIPTALIYQPGSTLSHALEFTAALLDPTIEQLRKAVSANGSVGNSPSATAFVLYYAWEKLDEPARKKLLSYLREAANGPLWKEVWNSSLSPVWPRLSLPDQPPFLTADQRDFGGFIGWPVTYPVNHFLEIWHEYYLLQLGELMPYSRLAVSFPTNYSDGKAGFGADEHFAIDADTTATYLCLAAQRLVKEQQFERLWDLLDVLLNFYNPEKGYFFTYPFEVTPSITTNAHALQALDTVLRLARETEFEIQVSGGVTKLQELRLRVAAYLRQKMVGQTCWQDKWHMSPLYATYHVVASGLLDREEPGNAGQRARIISWLLEKQSRLDGGWSFVKTTFWQDQNKGKANLPYPNTQPDPESSNADETFHALLLLLYAQKHWSEKGIAEGELIAAIQRGIATLKNILVHHPPHTWPALWCDKTLYCPYGLLYQLSEMLVCQVVETGTIIEEMVEPR